MDFLSDKYCSSVSLGCFIGGYEGVTWTEGLLSLSSSRKRNDFVSSSSLESSLDEALGTFDFTSHDFFISSVTWWEVVVAWEDVRFPLGLGRMAVKLDYVGTDSISINLVWLLVLKLLQLCLAIGYIMVS